MAYVAGQDEEDELQQAQMAAGGGAAPMSAPVGGNAAPAPAQQPPEASQQSKFVNFDNYFNANAAGAKSMADTMNASVDKQAGEAKLAVDKAGETFRRDTGWDKSQPRGIPGAPSLSEQGARPAPKTRTYAGPNPGEHIASGPEAAGGIGWGTPGAMTREDAQAKASKQYTGPKSLADPGYDLDGLASSTVAAQDQLGALQTDAGRQALLRRNGGSSSTGGNQLDSALLGRAGGQQFQDTAKKYGDLTKYLGDAVGASADIGSQMQGRSDYEADRYGRLVKAFDGRQEEAGAAGEARTENAAFETERRDTFTKMFDPNTKFSNVQMWGDKAGVDSKELQTLMMAMSPEDYARWKDLDSSMYTLGSMGRVGSKPDSDYQAFIDEMRTKYGGR